MDVINNNTGTGTQTSGTYTFPYRTYIPDTRPPCFKPKCELCAYNRCCANSIYSIVTCTTSTSFTSNEANIVYNQKYNNTDRCR
jgi:hypothetical protein